MTNTPKSSLRDHLTATTREGKIELAEEELTRVTGGAYDAFVRGAALGHKIDTFLKIDFFKYDLKI